MAVVGASGCGKSTLLRLILGLDDAHDGSITLGGAPVLGTSPDRGIVFQDHRLFPWLNVAQNIAVGLRNAPRSASEKRELVAEHIALVGLEGFEQSYPHQISGGMAQRVAIARGLVNRPRVLLLDEPFGALDALTRARLQTELQRIWQKERITMILVTHDVEEAVYLGDRVVIMQPRPGRIRRIVDVPLPHARNRSDPRFIRLRDDVLSDFLEPDGAPPTTARRWAAPPARWRRRRWPRCAWPGRPPQRSPLIRLGTPRHDPPSAPDQARRLPDADGHHIAAWRHPGAQADAAVNFRHYVDLARRAEAAKFDAIFLADAVGVRNTDLPSLSRTARSDHFEPLTLLSALAAVTEKIGLIATVSTTYNEPYHVARKFASLDQISGGRSGWNLVTSSGQGEAQNFSLDEHVEHAQLHARG